MKYAPHIYARALLEAMTAHPAKQGEILKNFVAVLAKTGDLKGVERILEAVERALTAKKRARYVEIESARTLSPKALELLTKSFSKEDRIRTRINQSLIAGVRIIVDDSTAIDATLKRRLEKLFMH